MLPGMSKTAEEVERKYELDSEAELPHLTGGQVATVGQPATDELESTYYDTADLALCCAGISLRRRVGGSDTGWQLKLPAGSDTRLEVHRALGRSRNVPVSLARMLTGVTAGAPLDAVADVKTTRTARDLLGAEGNVLARVCDDLVVAARLEPSPRQLGWRELEVELVDGDRSVLEDIHRTLKAAHVKQSSSPSKVHRALGDAASPDHNRPDLPRKSAGALLHDYLVRQRRQLALADAAVRATGAGVHDVRVAARRMRTAISVYRPLIDEQRARHLHAELRWFGRELSEFRDVEVARDSLQAALDGEPDLPQSGPVRTLVRRSLKEADQAATATARAALDSDRYRAILADLDALVQGAPWTSKAHKPASKKLTRLAAKPLRRLERATQAEAVAEPPDRDGTLHHVRKSAKRLRYALEVTEPVCNDAVGLANRARKVQSALGDYLDTVRTGNWLTQLGRDAVTGDAAFTFGRLHARNEAERDAHDAAYREAIEGVISSKDARYL